MWLTDLQSIVVAAGLPTGSVFLSSRAGIPTGDGPYLSIVETGGTSADRTHNRDDDGYERPGAQITARALTYISARTMLQTAYDAVMAIENENVNGTWYVEIRPIQKFIDLLPDESGRARVAFNVLGFKRPS